MAQSTPRAPAVVCAESIAALHLLHSIPAQPSSNPVTEIQSRSVGYTLPFEKERSLVGTLAFLAYTKDDINYIPAICVEEGAEAAYLNVLLAVNKATQDDGQKVLKELKEGFGEIFSLLSRADDSSVRIENIVFRAIVSMCSGRILHRLRLVPNRRNIQRQSIREALQIVFDLLRNKGRRQIKTAGLVPVLEAFVQRARDVLRLVDSWARHQTHLRLEELVDGIYHLRQAGNLHSLFETISNRDVAPSSKAHLLNMINKVARYRESARFLYRLAKKVSMARNMRIVLAQLPKKAFDRVVGNEYIPDLGVTVSSINELKKSDRDTARICYLLGSTEEAASSRFAEQTWKTLREAKVHAEIQLICYCQLNIPTARLPRVVCSSKDACWLCNEFILMHKSIHTPRCHGKLYPGWRLPMLCGSDYEDVVRKYNRRLQAHASSSVKTLFSRLKRTVYPDPNESTLFTLHLSTSTLSLVTAPELNIVDEDKPEEAPFSELELAQESRDADDEESEETLAEVPVVASGTLCSVNEGTDDTQVHLSSSAVSSGASSSSNLDDWILGPGKTKSKILEIGKSSPLYAAGPLEIQVEYAGTSILEMPDKARKKLSYTVECLEPYEVARLRNQGEALIIDAASLEGEIDHNTDNGGCIYIANGDAVLKLFMRSELLGHP
ncbi:hypothetical protein F4819DRAFT_487385 [Hypoxylon fuscum]|nr:hypothetical protein F4819DRAFT_487385 [Hypoxylon fuscum]